MLILCLPGPEASAASPSDNVTAGNWYAIDAGGEPFGSILTRRELLPDGNLRVVQISRSLIDLLGKRQEIGERIEMVVGPTMRPLSCSFKSDGPSGTSSAQGIVENENFVLTLRRGDVSLERRIPLREGMIFGGCLAEVLASQAAETSEVKLSILDSESWTAESAVARRLPDAAGLKRWSVAYDRGWGGGIWSLTTSGALARAEITAPRRSILPVMADVDQHLRYLTIADRDLLVFAISKDIPFPERLASIKVRLTWKDVPLERLQLEDSRQRILRHGTENDRKYVELLLQKPPEVRDPPALPVQDAGFDASLAETTFIRPQHPAIREQARKWTSGSQTTADAVRRLSREVSQFLQGGDLIAETLSGPEVLACRKGKCSEFTTLFASLSRSVGVPTRVALGMRLVGGRWVGHMWCEAWVGRWIPVDAAADEVGGSPALLKLAHSDDEMASQALRWALADSLDVEIIGVEAAKTDDSQLKTGIVGQTYTHADFGCRMKAPTPEWRISDKSTPGTVTIRFEPPGKFDGSPPKIELIALGMPVKMEPATLMSTVKVGLKAKFPTLEIVAENEKTAGRYRGRLLTFRRDDPKAAGQKLKTSEFIYLADGSLFLITLMADEPTHDAVFPQYEAVLDEFEIVGSAPAK
jgi:hypothetical protein